MSQPSLDRGGGNPANDRSRTALPAFLGVQAGGVRLAVKLQPRASTNEIGTPLGDELKIKVTAPPVDAAANEALLNLLAKTLGCARHRVELVRGRTSRHKSILLHGFEPGEIQAKLLGMPNES